MQHRPTEVEGQEGTPGAVGAGGAQQENRPLPSGKPTETKMPSKVRSSIACARCRRSKVKCVNSGVNTTCKACESTGRECQYPPSVPGSTPKRTEMTGGIKTEEGESVKKRIRKTADPDSSRNGPSRPEPVIKVEEGPLDSPVLTTAVWNEVFEIFKLHFSTEFSFLHQPTFLARVRQVMRRASGPHAKGFDDEASQSPKPPNTPELPNTKALLLGILTLTARFHPAIIAHHSSGPNPDPIVASEYYAEALTARLNAVTLTSPSIELIQALLMLGLHNWGMCRGQKSFLLVGMAVRMAQVMGLESEDDRDAEPQPNSAPDSGDANKASDFRVRNESDEVIEAEVRRRTLWSCFIMDRMLTAGRRRRSMIQVKDLCVQLPCSEEAFSFGERVQTGILTDGQESTEPDGNEKWRERSLGCVNDDGVLSRFIKMVEIWGRFCRWSCTGGRRNEKFPPWDSRTTFYKLRSQLNDFVTSLPNKLTFNRNNLSAHISSRTSTTYIRLHTLYSLCMIMLHREYIPFVPIRCDGPQGPVDEPLYPADEFDTPPSFWIDSAEQMYKAARDIMDVVRECEENFSLPITPQLGFAVYTAGFVGVVANHFPRMDTKKVMCDPTTKSDERQLGKWKGPTQLAISTLNAMRPRITMANGWCDTLAKMDEFYYKIKEDYHNHFQRSWSYGRHENGDTKADRKLSIRFGGATGGLEEYSAFEPELNEFGSLKDHEKKNILNGSSRPGTNGTAPSHGGKDEEMQGVEATGNMGRWQAINAASTLAYNREQAEASGTSYSQQQPGGIVYAAQGSPTQTAGNPPSLVSPSTSGSTPGALRSPFSRSEQDTAPYHNGVPANNIFPSVAGHSQPPMAPPRTQWDSQQQQNLAKLDKWAAPYESIDMGSTDINIFNQGIAMDHSGMDHLQPNNDYVYSTVNQHGYADQTNWQQAIYATNTAFVREAVEHQQQRFSNHVEEE